MEFLQVFRPLVVGVDQRRRVGVVEHILFEERLVVPARAVDDIVDQRAEKHDIAARAQRRVGIRHRAGAGEARVDVHELGPLGLGLHRPAKGHRVTLSHVRAHDHDRVGVLHVHGEGCGAAAPH